MAGGPQWRYRIPDLVERGKPATITLVPDKEVRNVKLVLRSASGKKKQFKVGRIAGGAERVLKWRAPKGKSEWSATLSGTSGGQTTTVEFDFTLDVLPPLDVKLKKSDVYLSENRIIVVPTRALKSAEIEIHDADGSSIVQTNADLSGSAAGEAVRIEWDATPGAWARNGQVDIKIHDAYGFWVGLRLEPFWVDIPHEEVVFETARWDVRPDEAPKLDRAVAAIAEAIAKAKQRGSTLERRLYIAGYTDTVGQPADNRSLSNRRARAIAEYLRDRGVAVPIFFQGFGEAALEVQTPDNVNEARNRRARYVVANSAPSGKDFPGRNWRRLP